jgi:hypothetical protein
MAAGRAGAVGSVVLVGGGGSVVTVTGGGGVAVVVVVAGMSESKGRRRNDWVCGRGVGDGG